jgi:hypothetical protein
VHLAGPQVVGGELRSGVLLSHPHLGSDTARSVVSFRGARWLVLCLAVVGVGVLGCAGDRSEPRVVTLAELVAEQDAYDGSMVMVEGTVRTYDQPRHYWIEDVEQHRVELFPHDLVEDLVGHQIRVTGRFTFVDDRGRGIDVEELDVLTEPPAASPS